MLARLLKCCTASQSRRKAGEGMVRKTIACVECSHCKGTGKIPLTGIYLETLVAVRLHCRDGGNVVAGRDAESFCCKATALNNRLAYLERAGFLSSEVYGRQRRYKPEPPP